MQRSPDAGTHPTQSQSPVGTVREPPPLLRLRCPHACGNHPSLLPAKILPPFRRRPEPHRVPISRRDSSRTPPPHPVSSRMRKPIPSFSLPPSGGRLEPALVKTGDGGDHPPPPIMSFRAQHSPHVILNIAQRSEESIVPHDQSSSVSVVLANAGTPPSLLPSFRRRPKPSFPPSR